MKKFAYFNRESKNVKIKGEPIFDIELMKLSNCFENATFNHIDSEWVAYMCFDINGETLSAEYEVNGYDSSVGIYTDEIENLSRTVNTLTEFWDTIDEIREVYSQKYDQRPDNI